MYECPNCAANLKFDIPSQKLKCDHCGTLMDPYEFQKERDVEETAVGEDEYEVTIFTCPQCGGELISDDTTAATFCSFCGGSAILDSRISKEKRPQHIIPFQKTKEDCKEAYGRLMRRAFFAPSELKDKEYIERFRSIYMPYWVYNFEKQEHVAFTGTQTERSGDYKITNYYKIESDVEAKHKGLAFDAAESFSDNLSNAIAPFEWREARPFTPSFLSGFYADTGDVAAVVYEEDAETLVHQDLCREMQMRTRCGKFQLGDDFVRAMKPRVTSRELAMFPVWFLTYRKKDRVSYVVVNGQTGKAAGDIPVDKSKYLWGSLLLALPIFVLMNLLVSMRASTMLGLTAVLALICCVISVLQSKRLRARKLGTDDKGRWGSVNVKEPAGVSFNFEWKSLAAPIVLLVITLSYFAQTSKVSVMIVVLCIAMFLRAKGKSATPVKLKRRRRQGISWGEFFRSIVKPGIGGLFAVLVLLVNPVSDLYYYGAALCVMALIGWNILDMIGNYNLLAARELPQFHRRGGEEDGR